MAPSLARWPRYAGSSLLPGSPTALHTGETSVSQSVSQYHTPSRGHTAHTMTSLT